MKLISFTLSFILLILFFHSAIGQGLPKSFPVKNSELTGKLPMGEGLAALSGKPEIPYLEELKQIQSLKKSYDSLRSEIRDLKEVAEDSTQRDSLFTLAKERSKEVLEKGK